MVLWFSIVRKLDVDNSDMLGAEMHSYVDKLNAMLLGQSIATLKGGNEFFNRTNNYMSKLESARKAMNWIAHESGHGLLFHHNKFYLDEFLDNVKAVARGDLLVSRWSYEFHEKEPAGWCPEELYVETISTWIYDDC